MVQNLSKSQVIFKVILEVLLDTCVTFHTVTLKISQKHKSSFYLRLFFHQKKKSLIRNSLWTEPALGVKSVSPWPLAVCARALQLNWKISLWLRHWLCLRLQHLRISAGLNEVWLPAPAHELEYTWETQEEWRRLGGKETDDCLGV